MATKSAGTISSGLITKEQNNEKEYVRGGSEV